MSQLDFNIGPTPARRFDPETSHAAAASITLDHVRRSQMAVLRLFAALGRMHDVRLCAVYRGPPMQSESGIRTRRRELTDMGFLRKTEFRVILPSGRKAIVWDITESGRRML
jgi:hypothetical protein